jgi:hypothetical protein
MLISIEANLPLTLAYLSPTDLLDHHPFQTTKPACKCAIMPAWETYYQELASKGHGHAVWDADPGQEPAVEIADVGYIEKGAFIQLFNASKEVGDASNKLGTPHKYTPIRIGVVRHGTLSAIQPITSETVLQRRIDVSVSGG